MAIIVEQLSTGNEYILVGTALGVDTGNLSSRFLKNWLPDKVALCDRDGKIFWLASSEVAVIEIDGEKPSELLPEPQVSNEIASVEPSPLPDLNAVVGDRDVPEEFPEEFEETDEEWL